MQYACVFVFVTMGLACVLLLRIHARAARRERAHLLEPLWMVNVFTLDGYIRGCVKLLPACRAIEPGEAASVYRLDLGPMCVPSVAPAPAIMSEAAQTSSALGGAACTGISLRARTHMVAAE